MGGLTSDPVVADSILEGLFEISAARDLAEQITELRCYERFLAFKTML